MRIAVTGCAGFIGAPLTDLLVAAGHAVLGIDDLSLGQPAPDSRSGFQFEQLDITDERNIRSVIRGFRPEQLIHLAAIHHIPTCEQRAPDAMRVNVVGTQILLDISREENCSKFVLASSGAVYDWAEGPLNEEKSPTRPYDTYATSKLANEHQVAVWQRRTGGTGIIARLFNTIGPRDLNGHLIPDIMTQLSGSSREPCVVRLGNTRSRRDYIYVDDTAMALFKMAEAQLGKSMQVFNVGTGREYGVLDILEGIANVLGVTYSVEIDPVRIRSIDRLHQVADIGRAQRMLGWQPEYDLETALRQTLALV